MNTHTQKVLALFLNLEPSQRDLAIAEIAKFNSKSSDEKIRIKKEWVSKSSVPSGPGAERSCPYCGK